MHLAETQLQLLVDIPVLRVNRQGCRVSLNCACVVLRRKGSAQERGAAATPDQPQVSAYLVHPHSTDRAADA
jgi:hypothetical protein